MRKGGPLLVHSHDARSLGFYGWAHFGAVRVGLSLAYPSSGGGCGLPGAGVSPQVDA